MSSLLTIIENSVVVGETLNTSLLLTEACYEMLRVDRALTV